MKTTKQPPDSILFEVQGAGQIAFSNNTNHATGTAHGCLVEPSWSAHGFSGGVMDRKEMVRLRDHLAATLSDKMTTPTEPTKADYVSAGLDDDKVKVTLIVRDRDGAVAIVHLTQQSALALAGEIQGFALQIRKP